MLTGLSTPFLQLMLPEFQTAQYLAQNNGQKAILFGCDDEVIDFSHVEKNMEAVMKAGKGDQLVIFPMIGDHNTALRDGQASHMEYLLTNRSHRDKWQACTALKEKIERRAQLMQAKLSLIDLENDHQHILTAYKNGEKLSPAEVALPQLSFKIPSPIDALSDPLKQLWALKDLMEGDWDTDGWILEKELAIKKLEREIYPQNDKPGELSVEEIRKEIAAYEEEMAEYLMVLSELPVDLVDSFIYKEINSQKQLDYFLNRAKLSRDLIPRRVC
jgi:hypothetical protein